MFVTWIKIVKTISLISNKIIFFYFIKKKERMNLETSHIWTTVEWERYCVIKLMMFKWMEEIGWEYT